MESIAEGTPPALAAMPRCEDGYIKLRELILRIVEDVANGVMGVEAEQMCEAIGNDRNGYRGRRLEKCAGGLNLRAPKLRSGGFFPKDVTERCQRIDHPHLVLI